MSENVSLDVFAKISDISKYLRKSIKAMPKYYQYSEGDEIKKLLRDMKFKAYLLQYQDCGEELYFMAQHLKILLDECLEEKALLMKGPYTIYKPRKKDLGADSLDCVEIAMELEKEFGITISDEDMEKHWTTVQEIVSYMENRVSNK